LEINIPAEIRQELKFLRYDPAPATPEEKHEECELITLFSVRSRISLINMVIFLFVFAPVFA
jgi:hypothetical protein